MSWCVEQKDLEKRIIAELSDHFRHFQKNFCDKKEEKMNEKNFGTRKCFWQKTKKIERNGKKFIKNLLLIFKDWIILLKIGKEEK